MEKRNKSEREEKKCVGQLTKLQALLFLLINVGSQTRRSPSGVDDGQRRK